MFDKRKDINSGLVFDDKGDHNELLLTPFHHGFQIASGILSLPKDLVITFPYQVIFSFESLDSSVSFSTKILFEYG